MCDKLTKTDMRDIKFREFRDGKMTKVRSTESIGMTKWVPSVSQTCEVFRSAHFLALFARRESSETSTRIPSFWVARTTEL